MRILPPAKSSFILASQRIEPYNDIKVRIAPAITFIQSSSDNYPNLTAIAQTYEIPVSRLRGRLQGRQSRHEQPGTNLKLTEGQELAVCPYLDCLNSIGTSARQKMVVGSANAILQYAHIGEGAAPVVGSHWAPRFPARHPEYHIRKQRSIDINRKNSHEPESIRACFEKYRLIGKDYNIEPCDQYNFDETGFCIGIGRD